MRKKMYSSIILVGGGCKFAGIEKWLQSKLAAQLPPNLKTENSFLNAKDTDPSIVTWKGAGIMSGLESAAELFISKEEWDKHGVRVLRERCPFTW